MFYPNTPFDNISSIPLRLDIQRRLEMREPAGPCKDCDKHSAECHSTCERYAEWKAELDEYKRWKYEVEHPEIRAYINARRYRRKR